MKRRLLSGMAAATALAASLMITTIAQPAAAEPLTADAASAASAQRAGGVTPNSAIKAPIHVDDTKNKIVATLRGVGKQVYTCGTDGKYALREPVAVLFNLRAGQAGIHGKGPFWALFDGSKVAGNAPAVPDPAQAGPGNVPWLLVPVTAELNTGGALAGVTQVQRIDTKGGVAPAACTTPTLSVDYSANYVFWAPK